MEIAYYIKWRFLYLTFLALLLCLQVNAKIRVACIGDSITEGATIRDREYFYPSQLQKMLPDNYEVKNFGASGHTLLSKGDFPYIKNPKYAQALEYKPNIVVIKLGTNDSKPQNMAHFKNFERDLTSLVKSFKELDSNPKIYLALPAFAARQAWGINEPDIFLKIIPAIQKVAKEQKLEIIDLHSILFNKPEFFNDGIHPNNYGARVIARQVARAILGEKQEHRPLGFAGGISDWNGFKKHEGRFSTASENVQFIIVEPKLAEKSKPWIWRPAFFGHEPQADIALLNLGFHVVYLDLTNRCGSPEAVKLGKTFCDFLSKAYRLSPKPVMEGLSRGGYYSLQFACAYPDRVSALYLDAPLCDLKWIFDLPVENPTAKEMIGHILREWKTSPEKVKSLPVNPMDRLDGPAKAKVPILSVYGDADTVCIKEFNTLALEKAYKKLGGKIELIAKPGVDHHPHSLKDPTPIVNFILKNLPNYDAAEYERQLKAYKKESPKFEQVDHVVNLRDNLANSRIKMESGKATVAFVGGSITEMQGWRDMVKEDLKRRYPNCEFTFIDQGIGSTGSTVHAFRLESDVLEKAMPDLLFFEATANDIANGFSPEDQVKGSEGFISHALKANPYVDIVMLHFIFEPFNSLVFNGTYPNSLYTHERVANRYGVSTVNLIDEIAENMRLYNLNWEEFGGGHPSQYGHEFYRRSINYLLDKAWSDRSQTELKKHDLPENKLDKFSYTNGKFLDVKKAKIKSGWKVEDTWTPSLKSGTRRNFTDVKMLTTNEPNSEFTLEFEGSAIGILCASGPDAGMLEYSVDGAPAKVLNTFTNWSNALYIPWAFMFEKELPKGSHTLRVKMLEGKDPRSRGTGLHIRNFLVNP